VPPEKIDENEHPGLAKIKAMYDRGDFETIDKMVKFWEALENLGVLGGMVRRFIMWSGVVAGGYLVANGYIVEWIKSIRQ
jgi:hypothetical protein